MGCFNKKGCFSNTPIRYEDRAVAIIGLVNKRASDEFAPGETFVPISLPIRGTYNDYGTLEHIEEAPAHRVVEKAFGAPIEKILAMAERASIPYQQIDPIVEAYLKKVNESCMPKARKIEYTLGYIIEHEAVFDQLVSMSVDRSGLEQDYDKDVNDDAKFRKFSLKSLFCHKGRNKIKREYISFLNPDFIDHDFACRSLYSNCVGGIEVDYPMILFPYQDSKLRSEYKKEFVDFAALLYSLYNLQMTWGTSNYYSQDVNYDSHIKFLDSVLKLMKKKKKEWKRYMEE